MRQDGKKTKKRTAERLQRTAEESAEKKSAKNAHCKYKNHILDANLHTYAR